jgi:hypothetical protein
MEVSPDAKRVMTLQALVLKSGKSPTLKPFGGSRFLDPRGSPLLCFLLSDKLLKFPPREQEQLDVTLHPLLNEQLSQTDVEDNSAPKVMKN